MAPPQAAKLGRFTKKPFGSHSKSSDSWVVLSSGGDTIDRSEDGGIFKVEAERENIVTSRNRTCCE